MTIITENHELSLFCAELAHNEFITIDTEFLREKTYYPKLCLIQLSGPNKKAKAIDPLVKGLDLTPLFDLLQNQNVVKVFHAARQDLEIFFYHTNHVVSPIFDTQIAAMVCGYGDSVGYESLVRDITDAKIDKSSQFTDWSLRPLSEKQLTYAIGDVTHLCDIYLHLKKKLEEQNRHHWLKQEEEILNNPDTYLIMPDKAWERIKIRSPKSKNLIILKELAKWREEKAQQRNVPKSWVIRDEVLADIARQAPKDKKQLAKIRTISEDTAKGKMGDHILSAIDTALNQPKETWPQPKIHNQHPSHIHATIDILKMLLKMQSAEHRVAPKLIANSSDLEKIALDDNADIRALKGWRHDIFGKDAIAIKHGKCAIGMKNGKITKFNIP